MSAQLRSTSHGQTMVLTLSHSEQGNRLTRAMMAAGIEALNVAERNTEISAVILMGQGTSFCSGLMRRAANQSAEDEVSDLVLFHQWLDTLRTFPKPIVAALEGEVIDEGLLLALSCDLIVAAKDCQLNAASLMSRLSPITKHAGLLANSMPHALAFELLGSSRTIAPERLHGLGLINHLCASGQAYSEAIELAERCAGTRPRELMQIKELLAATRAPTDSH